MTAAVVAVAGALGAELVLLQSDYGFWTGLIELLQRLIIAAGGVGFVISLAVRAVGSHRQGSHDLANKLMEGSLAGLLVGLLSVPIYNLVMSWTGG